MKLADITDVTRSKNAGPYELTFDLIFNTFENYEKAVKAELITPALFAKLYHIKEEDVICVVNFDPAKAIKVTIVRPIPSGALGEADVYGAQQHTPILEVELPKDWS